MDNETKQPIKNMTYEEWLKYKTAARPLSEKDILTQNDYAAIHDIALTYGINDTGDSALTLSKVADAVIQHSGLNVPPSRWSGNAFIDENLDADLPGYYDMNMENIYLMPGADLITALHEQFHSRSTCNTPELYRKHYKIEEAIVEVLSRYTASRYPVSSSKAYNQFIDAFNDIASLTELPSHELAADLLGLPTHKRYGMLSSIIDAYSKRSGVDQQEVTLYRRQLYVLKGE